MNVCNGCLHQWELSKEDSRQTICNLCGNCCEKGLNCEFNGVKGDNPHTCCCETHVTGCKHCGVCKKCAELFWVRTIFLFVFKGFIDTLHKSDIST